MNVLSCRRQVDRTADVRTLHNRISMRDSVSGVRKCRPPSSSPVDVCRVQLMRHDHDNKSVSVPVVDQDVAGLIVHW
jgi:hypothetical protein